MDMILIQFFSEACVLATETPFQKFSPNFSTNNNWIFCSNRYVGYELM